jgi:NlpC/P60 family putative phage cell wall peptidase
MREQIVSEARRWLRTPYHHQAVVRGVGVDCVGLIRGVGHATGALPEDKEAWARFGGYSRIPNPRRMGEGMRQFLRLVEGTPQPGDIAWLEWRDDLPMHLAILASDSRGGATLIHSYSDAGGVVEHGLTPEWLARIKSWWRYPNLEGEL